MFTIIGGDGKEYGPATAEQIRGWITAGRANLDTQARAAGTEEWRRLGDFPEFNSAAASAVPPPIAGTIPAPLPTGPVDLKAYTDEVLARAGQIDVFDCLGRSFDLWKNNFLPLVGVTLLVIVAQMAASMVPILGTLAGMFLNGVFYGGLYYYYLGKMRGQPRTVGDAFAGFSKAFVPLMLASLLITALTIALMAPAFGSFFVAMIHASMANQVPTFGPISGTIAIAMLISFLVMLYLSVGWMFTFALVIDKGLGPWTAMEVSRRVVTRQWFRVFFVGLLGGFLTLLGFIGLFIGILFTLPLMFGAVLYAYETIFNPPPR